jgi:hypothetical protein
MLVIVVLVASETFVPASARNGDHDRHQHHQTTGADNNAIKGLRKTGLVHLGQNKRIR